MENPMTFQVHYTEHQRQAAWVNANDWQFAKREKRYRMRQAVANALIALAKTLAPTTQDARTA